MKMKMTFLALLGLGTVAMQAQGLNNAMRYNDAKAPKMYFVALTTGTPAACSATNLLFTSATFYGYKAASTNAAPTPNTADAYLGIIDSAGTVTVANNAPLVEVITKGESVSIDATPGEKLNFANYTVSGATGDKVLIVYHQ